MKKIKRFSAFLAALILSLSFSACDITLSVGSPSGSDSEISDSDTTDDGLDDGETSDDATENTPPADGNSSDDGTGNTPPTEDGAETPTKQVDELSVHFLYLGNNTSGDCTLIKTGDTEILIDAGSTTSSAGTIVPYISRYCTDGVLEYVIATHGDQDHIASFVGGSTYTGVFDNFVCETIIDAPRTNKTTQIYKNYVAKRDAEVAAGAKHYTALECWNNQNGAQRSYVLGEGITLNILYQKYYEVSHSVENNYSVCVLISQEENHYLFTGDLEESGEKSLVESNDLPKCKLYKAGHHGSKTATTAELMAVVQPEVVVASCCCGDKFDFPHQEFLNNIAPYTDKLYIPLAEGILLNGNIVVNSTDGKTVSVACSNNNTLFKDTDWFKNNRVLPEQWK